MKSQLVKIGVLLFSSSLVVLFILYQMGSFDKNRFILKTDFPFKRNEIHLLKENIQAQKKLLSKDSLQTKKNKTNAIYKFDFSELYKDFYYEFDPTIVDSSDYKASIAKIKERNSRLLDTNNLTIDSSEIAPIRFYSSKSGGFVRRKK
jgi:hypothetical protein